MRNNGQTVRGPQAWCATQGLEEVRGASGRWEAQAQSGLAQVERLKDLLEETARWSPAGHDPDGNPVRVAKHPSTGVANGDAAGCAAASALADGWSAAEPASAPAACGTARAEPTVPVAGHAAAAGAAQAVEQEDAGAARQRADAAEAEAASLRRDCAQLEEQLRWQRAAAASGTPCCLPVGPTLPKLASRSLCNVAPVHACGALQG